MKTAAVIVTLIALASTAAAAETARYVLVTGDVVKLAGSSIVCRVAMGPGDETNTLACYRAKAHGLLPGRGVLNVQITSVGMASIRLTSRPRIEFTKYVHVPKGTPWSSVNGSRLPSDPAVVEPGDKLLVSTTKIVCTVFPNPVELECGILGRDRGIPSGSYTTVVDDAGVTVERWGDEGSRVVFRGRNP